MTYKSLTCQKCGQIMKIEKENDDFRTLTCPACGSKELIEESDAVKTARIQAEIEKKSLDNEIYKEQMRLKEEHRNNNVALRIALGCFISLLAIIAFGVIMTSSEIWSQWDDENLTGLPYQETAQILKDAGFRNIECIAMNDLEGYFFLTRNQYVDKVDKVSIGGKTDFHKKGLFQEADRFHKNDSVTIWYHSFTQTEDEFEEVSSNEELPNE